MAATGDEATSIDALKDSVVDTGYLSDASADDDNDSPEIAQLLSESSMSGSPTPEFNREPEARGEHELSDGETRAKQGGDDEQQSKSKEPSSADTEAPTAKSKIRRNGFQKYTSVPMNVNEYPAASKPRRVKTESEPQGDKDPADRIYDQKHIFRGDQMSGGVAGVKGIPWIKNPTASTRRYSWSCVNTEGSDYPSIFTAYDKGRKTDHVQCVFVRHRGTLGTTFELYYEASNRPLLLASKVNFCTTVNYHIFDMTQGLPSETLSKESPNYVGKLRGRPGTHRDFILVNAAWEREEIAAYRFNAVQRGQPRNLCTLTPGLQRDATPIPNKLCLEDAITLLDAIDNPIMAQERDLHVFRTKMPFLQNGYYRLDFKGRVPAASTKNVQFVSVEDVEDVVLQFGKVEQDVYHLDFKAPFSAIQAFGLALCQFEH